MIGENKKFYETEITLPDEEKSSSFEKISELRKTKLFSSNNNFDSSSKIQALI